MLTVFDTHTGIVMVTHVNYTLYRRCDILTRYTKNKKMLHQKKIFYLDHKNSNNCRSIRDSLWLLILIIGVIVIIGGFIFYRTCDSDRCKYFVCA